MQTNKYQWRIESLAKGIDPDAAMKELEHIEIVYGALTPENIVQASQAEDAILHALFDWNDETAAHKYRIRQAATILNNIEVSIIHDGEERMISSFEIIKNDDESKSYKNVENFTASDIEQVRKQAVRELNNWKNKLTIYSEFSRASKKLEQAVELLDK